ncbi:MAG: TonB-dependent receptor, partial [Saprospiraceae bacterium]|nr:TonB-dependent receptor [Saprospiraceae bacterium]
AVDGYRVVFGGDDNFAPQVLEGVNLRSNQNISVQLTLQKALMQGSDLKEVVVSSGAVTAINRQDAEVSFEMKAREIQELPVEGRDITRVLYRLPNITQATGFYPEAPNVSINGANGLFTSYLIDGMDNNERFLGGQKFNIPSGFVKDITVLTSNFSAEYGLTGSGVVDITSKSGSNETTGEAFFLTRPGPAIDAPSAYAQRDLSGNQVRDGFARYQAGVGVGGALKKDRTFYYFNFEHTTDVKDNLLNVADLGINETVRGTNTFNYISGKIDQIWRPNFRSSLKANVGLVGIDRQGGGLEGGVAFPSSGDTQQRNSALVTLRNAYNFGQFAAESNVQYASFRWNYAEPVNPNDPQVVVRNPNDQVIAILGNPGYVFDSHEKNVQFQQKIKYYAKNHTVKAGFNLIRAQHELFGGGAPNGNYTVDLTQAQMDAIRNSGIGANLGVRDLPADVEVTNYNIELRPNSFGATQNIFSAYVEDLWSVSPRLNLTLGLRYDYDNLSKGGGEKGDYNNLAPRVHLNYKLTENSSLRGGYGMAYDKINYAIYSDALQQNTTSADYKAQLQELVRLGILPQNTNIDAITFDGNASATVSGVTYLQGPSNEQLQGQREKAFSNERRILNPNGYQNPLTHQISLGYQLQMDENKLFFVDLIHNRGENLFRIRNLNAAAEYPIDPNNVVVRTPAEADATRPIPIVNNSAVINGETLTGVARNVVMTETAGRSEYYAASFNFQKAKGEDNYAFRLNYTLSSLKNNTDDINFRAQDANNYDTEWGPSINDRTHNINGIFQYYPFKNTVVSMASLLQSGQPINRIPLGFGTSDLNGDGSAFGDAYVGNSDRYPGESRNSDRLPWSNTFDLAVQHRFKVGKRSQLELRADVFNLFNAENLSGYSNNATQSNQIQAGPSASGLFQQRNAAPPRQFQFGIRLII